MSKGVRRRESITDLTNGDVSISELIDAFDLEGMPIREETSLIRQRQSLTLTIMADAWKNEGVDLDDPGRVDQYYFPNEGFVVVDLNDE